MSFSPGPPWAEANYDISATDISSSSLRGGAGSAGQRPSAAPSCARHHAAAGETSRQPRLLMAWRPGGALVDTCPRAAPSCDRFHAAACQYAAHLRLPVARRHRRRVSWHSSVNGFWVLAGEGVAWRAGGALVGTCLRALPARGRRSLATPDAWAGPPPPPLGRGRTGGGHAPNPGNSRSA